MDKKALRIPVYYLMVTGLTLLQASGLGLVYCAISASSDAGAVDLMIFALITLLVGISAIGFIDQLLDEFREQMGLPARKPLRPIPDAVRDVPTLVPTRRIIPIILLASLLQVQYAYAPTDEAAANLLSTYLGGTWLLVIESAWLKLLLENGLVRKVFNSER